MAAVPVRREETQRHLERRQPCDGRGIYWNEAFASQGTQGLPANTSSKKARERFSCTSFIGRVALPTS